MNPHVSLTAVEASAHQVRETLPTLDVAISQIVNGILEVIHLVPQEPVLQRTDEHIIDVRVPETIEKTVEVERSTPQKHISERIEESDVVYVPIPQIVNEIVPAATCGALARVLEHMAAAPVDVSIAPTQAVDARPDQSIDHVAPISLNKNTALPPPVDTTPAPVIEYVAPVSLDEYDASMLKIIESFHHAVKQIADVPAPASVAQHSAQSAQRLLHSTSLVSQGRLTL